ncbi:MAG: reverse transcriptase family protein [Planctomycetaceae bacterium]
MNVTAARAMTAAMLAGDWNRRQVLQRLRNCLGRTGKGTAWPAKLVALLFGPTAFPERRPAAGELTDFLRMHPAARKVTARAERGLLRWSAFARTADGAPAMWRLDHNAAWNVPSITTPAQLCDVLELSAPHLDWLADCRGLERTAEGERLRNYRYTWVRKSSGGYRLLEVPKQRLKAAQRWIASSILNRIPAHDAAHAFVSGRSPVSAARRHLSRDVVLRIDLKNFFPSIAAARVAGIFRSAGYPQRVVSLLTGLCTNCTWQSVIDLVPGDGIETAREQLRILTSPHLPQGAPTSPALANLCAYSLDVRLTGLAKKFDAFYTRYADDLVFSGGLEFRRRLQRFRIHVLAIAHNEGFEIRRRKTAVMKQDECQRITGVVVNQRPNIDRRDYDRLKAILTNCVRYGLHAQNHSGHADFRSHLQGRVAHVRAVHPNRGAKLQAILDRIPQVPNSATTTGK